MKREPTRSLGEAIAAYIQESHLEEGLLQTRIFAAWDACSGAGEFTLKRFFREGKLYITLSSSVIRNQLSFQKTELIEKMNRFLSEDSLFTEDNRTVSYIRELVLR